MCNMFFRFVFSLALPVLMLASCDIIRPYRTPAINTSNLFRDTIAADTNTISNLRYNEIYTDPLLQKLIAQGIARNPNLQIAYTRVQQAQAYYAQSGAVFLPALNANASVTRSKFSEAQSFGIRESATQYQLGLSSSWEIDVWGKLRSNRRASLASFLQSEAAARAVQTSLVSSIATFYFTLLALDQQLVITQQTVVNCLIRKRKKRRKACCSGSMPALTGGSMRQKGNMKSQ